MGILIELGVESWDRSKFDGIKTIFKYNGVFSDDGNHVEIHEKSIRNEDRYLFLRGQSQLREKYILVRE